MPPRFESLDWIRGLAALWVFAFHYGFSQSFQESFPGLFAFFRLGDLGVPIFFVISGYCMAVAVERSRAKGDSIGQFLSRRFRRIYPTFWCSIAVAMAVPVVIEFLSYLKTGTFAGLDRSETSNGWLVYTPADWLGVITLTRVFFYLPDANGLQGKFNSLNAVYWTLAIEVQFYLIVSLATVQRISLIHLNYVLILVGTAWHYLLPSDLSGICLPYWPLFGAGIVLSQLTARGYPSHYVAIMLKWLGLLLLPFSVVWLHQYWLPFCVCVMIWLWLLSTLDEKMARSQRHGPLPFKAIGLSLTFLGVASYSIYLLHGRVMHLGNQVARQIFGVNSTETDMMTILVTLIVCALFYWVAERPFTKSKSSSIAIPISH